MGTIYYSGVSAPPPAPECPSILADFPRLPDGTVYVTRRMIEDDEKVAMIVRATLQNWSAEFDLDILIWRPKETK